MVDFTVLILTFFYFIKFTEFLCFFQPLNSKYKKANLTISPKLNLKLINLPNNFSKKDFENQYKKIGKVHNPFFDEEILFDRAGWDHLLKGSDGKFRNQENLQDRLSLISFLPQLLSINISPIEPRIKTRDGLVIKIF